MFVMGFWKWYWRNGHTVMFDHCFPSFRFYNVVVAINMLHRHMHLSSVKRISTEKILNLLSNRHSFFIFMPKSNIQFSEIYLISEDTCVDHHRNIHGHIWVNNIEILRRRQRRCWVSSATNLLSCNDWFRWDDEANFKKMMCLPC